MGELTVWIVSHLVLEVLHDPRGGGGAVDEDEAHAAVGGGHPEAGEDVGAGALGQPDAELDAEPVEHRGQVLADLLHRGEAAAAIEGRVRPPRDFSYYIFITAYKINILWFRIKDTV